MCPSSNADAQQDHFFRHRQKPRIHGHLFSTKALVRFHRPSHWRVGTSGPSAPRFARHWRRALRVQRVLRPFHSDSSTTLIECIILSSEWWSGLIVVCWPEEPAIGIGTDQSLLLVSKQIRSRSAIASRWRALPEPGFWGTTFHCFSLAEFQLLPT